MKPGFGSDIALGNVPAEFMSDEPNVRIEFDWVAEDPPTHSDPGSPGGVEVTRVTVGSNDLDIEEIPTEVMVYFEDLAYAQLAEAESRAEADHQDYLESRRDDK